MQTTAVTRAQLAQAFRTGQPITIPQPVEILDPVKHAYRKVLDPDMVLVLAANVLGCPLRTVKVTGQEGRFLVVDYTPVHAPDPDILIVLESGPAADAFHRAVRGFQDVRRRVVRNWSEWFTDARASVYNLVGPLWALRPSQAEANFCLRWAMLTAARGRLVKDGIRPAAAPAAEREAEREAEMDFWGAWGQLVDR